MARLSGVNAGYISSIEKGSRKNPSIKILNKIANALGVAVERLTGESASSIIENRLDEMKATYEELAKKAGVPLFWLQNLDSFTPGEWGGEDDVAYKWIAKVADVLGIPTGILRAALARQEIPVYDGPHPTPEEDFGRPSRMAENERPYKLGDLIKVNFNNMIRIPILGVIRAGEPIFAEQNIIGYDYIEKEKAAGEQIYELKVTGDSMNQSGILDGDFVIVRKDADVSNGDIAVVMINGYEATVKKFYRTETNITLTPNSDNPAHQPKIINLRETDVQVLGKVIGVKRFFN